MKKGTALFMAFMMIVGIVGGGVVYFSIPAYALEYENNIYRAELPIVSAADVNTNGSILAISSDGTNIIRAGANENGLYPFAISDQLRFASKAPGKVFIYNSNNTVQFVNADRTFEYSNGKTVYFYRVNTPDYNFTIPVSGNDPYNMLYDASCFLYYNGSQKLASFLGGTVMGANPSITLDSSRKATVYNWSLNSNSGYLVRVDSTIYFFTNSSLYLRITDYNGNTIESIPHTDYITYGDFRINYCRYTDSRNNNTAVLNFSNFNEAADQCYYWMTGRTPEPDPNPDVPNISGTMSYSLMPGYALVLHSSNTIPVLITAQQKYMSASFANNNNSWWWQDSRFYDVPSSLPSVGDNYPGLTSSYTLIPWQKQSIINGVEAWHNIFGQTDQAIFAYQFNSGYVMIVNPVSNYYDSNIIEGKNRPNGPITVEFDATEAYVYSCAETTVGEKIAVVLTESFILGGNGATYDSDNNRVNLQSGGSTYVDDTQKVTLDQLVSDIDEFFSGTWRHIRQMITSAGKLPSVIIEMYSWLPEEYKGVLFSAFGIVAVVAILKVML